MKKIMIATVALLLSSTAGAQSLDEDILTTTFYGDDSGNYYSPTCPVATIGEPSQAALPIVVNPWVTSTVAKNIRITHVQCSVRPTDPSMPLPITTMVFIGNSSKPDIMAIGRWDGGSVICDKAFRAGESMSFPTASGAVANGPGQNNCRLPHIDLHVENAGGVQFQAFLVIDYKIQPE